MSSLLKFLFPETRPLAAVGIIVLLLLSLLTLGLSHVSLFNQIQLSSEFIPEYVEFGQGQVWTGFEYIINPNYGYALFEKAATTFRQPEYYQPIAFMALATLGLGLLIGGLTYLEGVFLYIVTGLLAIGSVFLVPDLLVKSEYAFRALQLYVVLCTAGYVYLVSSFAPFWGTGKRVFIGLALQCSWVAISLLLGSTTNSFWNMASYGFMPWMILCLLFVIQTSYVLPYLFFQLTVRQRLFPLVSLAIGLIFLGGNFMITYFVNRGELQFSGYTFSPLFFFLLSGLVGYRVFKDFALANFSWFGNDCRGTGVVWWGWLIISLAVLLFSESTDNAAILEVVDDVVCLAYFGACMGFLAYVYANFFEGLRRQLPIDQIFFKFRYLPVFIIAATTVFITFVFISKAGKFQLRQAEAGIYNLIGDGWLYQHDAESAGTYFERATDFETYNVKANLSLAYLAARQNDPDRVERFLKMAVETKAQPEDYIQLGNFYTDQQKFFESYFAYKSGLEKYPHNADILNNLLVQMALTNLTDSLNAFARNYLTIDPNGARTHTNLSALAALGKLPTELEPSVKTTISDAAAGNMALARARAGRFCEGRGLEAHGKHAESVEQFIPIFNKVATCLSQQPDTALLGWLIRSGAQQPGFEEDARFAASLFEYASGDKLQAFKQVDNLAATSLFAKAFYYKKAVTWALAMGSPSLASRLLSLALEKQIALPKYLFKATDKFTFKEVDNSKHIDLEEVIKLDENDRLDYLLSQSQYLLPLELGRIVVSFSTAEKQWEAASALYTQFFYLRLYAELTALSNQITPSLNMGIKTPAALHSRNMILRNTLHEGSIGALSKASNELIEGANPAYSFLIEMDKRMGQVGDIRKVAERNPFTPEIVKGCIELLVRAGRGAEAFEVARDAYQLTPEEPMIAELYIEQSMLQGYDSFARSALDEFERIFGAEKAENLNRKLANATAPDHNP